MKILSICSPNKLKRLPWRPSQLIRIAIADFKAITRDPRYIIDMDTWHRPAPARLDCAPRCHVCFAGAVMARQCGLPPNVNGADLIAPGMPTNGRKFLALNAFRRGRVFWGLRLLGLELPPGFSPVRNFPLYDIDPRGFFRAVSRLATDFEKRGL